MAKLLDLFRTSWKRFYQKWLEYVLTRKWFDVGLRSKMSLLVTVGLIGLISIFAFIAISTFRQATQQQLSEHVLRARILAESLDSSLSHVAGMLTILSSQINMDSSQTNLEEWEVVFERDFRPVQGVYLFDSNNHLLAATATAPNIKWEDMSLAQTMDSNLTRNIIIDGIPRPYAVVAVPVTHPNSTHPEGTLAAIIDLSNPDIFISSSSLDTELDGTLQILDSQGQVLVSTHPDRTLTENTIEKITNQLFTEDKPRFEACLGCTTNELNTGTVIAFASLSQAPWMVVIWHDSQELFAPVRMMGFQTIVLGLVAILGALGLVMMTTRSVIAPIQMLTDATEKIGEVQFDTTTLKSIEYSLATTLANKTIRRRDEIGVLANSFITMCTRLQQSMEEIQSWNRELDARVQARTQQLSILNTVALTVNQSLNLDDILDRALDDVLKLKGIDVIAIYLHDSVSGQLALKAHRGLSEKAARTAYKVGMLDGDCGGVLELGRIIVVPDISSYRGRGARSLQREKVKSLVHVPLMTKGWALGSMCVGTHDTTQFGESEQSLLSAIGNQIAIAVENARLYADVQRKERVRGELFKKTLAAQEDERKRIARELHDEVSQSLTALLYDAENGLELDDLPAIRGRLQSICDLTQHTLENIHKLMFDLRPSMLDQLGLIPALRWLSETRLEPKGIRVKVNSNLADSEINTQRLSPEIETALYRVVQEAINNIARHSAARNVEIFLTVNNDVTNISITDDGIGFDLTELRIETLEEIDNKDFLLPENTRGLGLLGMQERIELLGGELDIDSTLSNGTKIHIHVPIAERSPIYD
ncbi:MAG: GAF domain-containing protein [Anaerolineales bacterium]|uniref:histidine kinase n=1 Tax=Candidatus Desulfolinea nitratireducens TaxID=2841698 RepID=A0A8J6NP60_9CHLR|nr:GAF domain-containing protein [Candidatus Desulfolinea nitratireducens]MBL6959660.1 GAF domain-containing protein [Anaerolineales bacterium]